ncbi:MAG: DNA-processing protein DprA [Facklamia hominis]
MQFKQALIYLDLKKVSYHDRWVYLNHLLTSSIRDKQDCHALSEKLSRLGAFNKEHPSLFKDWVEYEAQVAQLSKQTFAFGENTYPKLWLQIPQPPLLVYYQGDLSLLEKQCVSIIGSRKLSAYGQKASLHISQALLESGFVLVSGLAKGVDYICQQRADRYRPRTTIAILPSGFNQPYPREHAAFQDRLAQRHLILSEYFPDQGPRKYQFVGRNRLVAGLSLATVIIQAAQRSGSLITANYALEYNRQIYALPGPIDDPQSKGCNELIAAGAAAITDIPGFVQDLHHLYACQQDITRPK